MAAISHSSEPTSHLILDAATLDCVAECCRAFTHQCISRVERLEGGLSNSNFKIQFELSEEPVVLRIYERDPAACKKELELLFRLRQTLPVPELLYAEPKGIAAVGPFAFLRFVEGITFRHLKSAGSHAAIQQATYSVGKTLAAIGNANVTESPSGLNLSTPDSIETYLRSPKLIGRVGERVVEQLKQITSSWDTRLRALTNDRRLVHGDFRKQNILVRANDERWEVAAILDWECSFVGSPMYDVGLCLRYERQENAPAFANGFRDGGGELPGDWFALSRVVDLESLCRGLTTDLPPAIEHEIVALVNRTVAEIASTCA